ncbi:MAG: cell division protein ZapA [Proteobacteria bacterium]|nr:cell division protein ZapA [Pseudomonadota bacterium]
MSNFFKVRFLNTTMSIESNEEENIRTLVSNIEKRVTRHKEINKNLSDTKIFFLVALEMEKEINDMEKDFKNFAKNTAEEVLNSAKKLSSMHNSD